MTDGACASIWLANAQPQEIPPTKLGGLKSRQRRSKRLPLCLSVLVYGRAMDKRFFKEEASTLLVNAHEGLIALEGRVMVPRMPFHGNRVHTNGNGLDVPGVRLSRKPIRPKQHQLSQTFGLVFSRVVSGIADAH